MHRPITKSLKQTSLDVQTMSEKRQLVAGHGEAVAEADTPRGHGVSHAC